jgi:hypothetical protein
MPCCSLKEMRSLHGTAAPLPNADVKASSPASAPFLDGPVAVVPEQRQRKRVADILLTSVLPKLMLLPLLQTKTPPKRGFS